MADKILIASYFIDWFVIITIAGIGAGLNYVEPYKRPFSLIDLSISYPELEETISVSTLAVICLAVPAIAIFVIVAAFVPGPRTAGYMSRSVAIKRKLWEWERGWAGLALSLASDFLITQGMKNLFGKPRPSCIARCQPDLNDIERYSIGGYGQSLNARWTLVSPDICTNPDPRLVNDAFKSFPSGHASFSWAGMLYLFLFLCSKFAIQTPFLPTESRVKRRRADRSDGQELLPLRLNVAPVQGRHHSNSSGRETAGSVSVLSMRDGAASPPNHLLVIAFLPLAVATYVCSTRFVEYFHFGFDLIFGSLIGILSAWLAFRWYHMPIGKGAGWAWGPRDPDKAWGVGVGVASYATGQV